MKNLYLIGGTMGIGKTTVCQRLKVDLPDCVFLDGDRCWDSSPFKVNEETKAMVIDNICYLLNNFIHSYSYDNIIFCWVMHRQEIIDTVLKRLDTKNCEVKCISLIADEDNLKKRLSGDIEKGVRKSDIIERSIERLALYEALETIKIDTNNKTICEIAEEIKKL